MENVRPTMIPKVLAAMSQMSRCLLMPGIPCIYSIIMPYKKGNKNAKVNLSVLLLAFALKSINAKKAIIPYIAI